MHADGVDWSLQSNYTSTYPHTFASDTLETPGGGADDSSPVSVCSTPCSPRQYSIQQELPCCWECRSASQMSFIAFTINHCSRLLTVFYCLYRNCGVNEFVAYNKTGCLKCPEFEWPDEETALYCEPIPSRYMLATETMAISLKVW